MGLGRFIAIAAIAVSIGAAPATQPGGASTLELRATTAFNNGQYALALPLLQRLQTELKSDSDKQGLIAEQIRVCKAQLANAPAAQAVPGDQPAMTAETRKPHAAPGAGEVRDLEIKQLGNFEYDAEKGGNIPPDVAALSGIKLRLRGYMIPMDQADKITQFALVPSLFACCFGQPPTVQHTIVCNTPQGKAVGYYPDEISVEGTLKVEEKKEDGFIVSLFEVDVTSVKSAVK